MDKIYLLMGFIMFWGLISVVVLTIGSIIGTLLLYFIRTYRIYNHPIVGGKVNGKEPLTIKDALKYTWFSTIYGAADSTTIGGYLFPLLKKSREHSWYNEDEDEDE